MRLATNHILEQYTAEFLRAYPGAKVLMASKDDLAGDRRRTLLSRIATGDWDAVIITHSSFERIPPSQAFMESFINAELERIEDALRQMRAASRGNRIVKELARAKKQWQAKLLKLSRKDKKDDILTFEDLGIDWLFIDEAHCFPYQVPVLTESGWIPIGEVVEKRLATRVASVDLPTGQIEWKPVTDWITSRTSTPLVRVVHEGGILECTADHEIWTYEEGYVEAKDLTPEHQLRVLRKGRTSQGQRGSNPEVLRLELCESSDRPSKGRASENDHEGLRTMQENVFVSIAGPRERRKTPVLHKFLCRDMAELATGATATIQGVDRPSLGVLEGQETPGCAKENAAGQPDAQSGKRGEGEPSSSRSDVSVARREREADGTGMCQ